MKLHQVLAYITLFTSGGLAAPQADPVPGAHFSTAESSILGSGALQVCFSEAGLGNNNVTYQLSASETAELQCFNLGGNHPQAGNKESFSSQVFTTETLEAKNGRIDACITGNAPNLTALKCPGNQVVVLVSVSYTNIVLVDTINSVTTTASATSTTFPTPT